MQGSSTRLPTLTAVLFANCLAVSQRRVPCFCQGVDEDLMCYKQLASRVLKQMKQTTCIPDNIEMMDSLAKRLRDCGHHFELLEEDNDGIFAHVEKEMQRKTAIEIEKCKVNRAERKAYREAVVKLYDELVTPLHGDDGDEFHGNMVRNQYSLQQKPHDAEGAPHLRQLG